MAEKLTQTNKISVIIASYNAGETIESCLQSLQQQKNPPHFEVIVVDSSSKHFAGNIRESAPWVQLYHFKERKYPGDARNFGISKASGNIIAFIDTDCIAGLCWLNEIATAHKQFPDHEVIGGSIDNANPESVTGWAAYFCAFSQWIPQEKPVEMNEIPTCCLSMKKSILDRIGPFEEGTFSSDSEFSWRLKAAGVQPLFIPRISISHLNISNPIVFLKKSYVRGKHFAALRGQQFGRIKNLVYGFGAALLPFLLSCRRGRHIFRAGLYQTRFIAVLPLTFSGLVFWSLGECVGYLSNLAGKRRFVSGSSQSPLN